MRTEVLHINSKNANKIFFEKYNSNGSNNNQSLDKMKHILSKAMLSELTERQRACVSEYYFAGKKEKEIGESLGIDQSTVSRHLITARKKLRHIASYYM